MPNSTSCRTLSSSMKGRFFEAGKGRVMVAEGPPKIPVLWFKEQKRH
jgi:hypothetical protein